MSFRKTTEPEKGLKIMEEILLPVDLRNEENERIKLTTTTTKTTELSKKEWMR